MPPILQTLLEKSGVNKGDVSTGSFVGGLSLGVIFMLFVSQHQYEIDKREADADRGRSWHQIHVIMDTLNSRGIYIPNEDDFQQPTNQPTKTP
jgi:hypothetical protein